MYIIIEIQTNTDQTIGILTYTAQSWREAQHIYNEKLSYAALSTLPCQAVSLLDSYGRCLESRYYSDIDEGVENE